MKKKKMSMKKVKGYQEHTREELEDIKIHIMALAKTHVLSKTMKKELEVLNYVIEMKRATEEEAANKQFKTRPKVHVRERTHRYRWHIENNDGLNKTPHLAVSLINGPISIKQAEKIWDYFTEDELRQFMADQDLDHSKTQYQSKTDMLLLAGARGIMPVPPRRYARCKRDGHVTVKQRCKDKFIAKCSKCGTKIERTATNSFISENYLEDN